MKPFGIVLTAAGLAVGVAMTAGAQSASASGSAAASETAQTNTVTERYMTSVQTELTSKLDSKNAAVGQQVTAKTKQTATLADGTKLPKGTRLVGHVTSVQSHSKDQPYATLAMTFDRAELAGGKTVSLRSVMRAVAPPAALSASDNGYADTTTPMGGMGASASAGGGGSTGGRGGLGVGGGGGLGGGLGGTVRGVGQTAGSTVGGVGANTRSTVGAVDRTADSTVGATGGVVSRAGETLSEAPRATGLPGVMLSSSTTADVSGTLSAEGKNVTLDSGTQITLSVIAR